MNAVARAADAQVEKYRIVVGVGRGGETGEQAVRAALRAATRGGDAELHVVTALPGDVVDPPGEPSQRLLDEEKWLADYVQWVADRTVVRVAGLDLVFHVRVGDPVAVLTQVACDVGATLIVVGAHNRSRVAQLLGGSVAEKLFTEGRYSVLVARAPDEEGLEKNPRPEPRRPGQALGSPREAVLESSDRVDFTQSAPRVSSSVL